MFRWTPIVATALAAVSLLALFVQPVNSQRRPGLPNQPGQPGGSEGDWFNLGPMGGKATMESAGGKTGLTVRKVFEGGPAAAAGLKEGDFILGAPKDFVKDAYHELGAAIEAAECAKKDKEAIVELTLGRGGQTRTLKVQVRAFGPEAKKFPGGKMRDTIVDESLKWLASQQQGDGGWECHLSGENGRTVMTSLCGLAFLAAGHTAGSGEYKTNVKKAADFVVANVGQEGAFGNMGGGANWNQTNWGLGYGGIFLAEVQSASAVPGVKEKLEWICDRIQANMEATGGFAHGPGGPNALNYLELEIVSNYCVAALGGIQANGIKVDKSRIERALAYIQACGGGKGGVGYSTREGQIGWGDPGRTGGAIMAFGAVGRDNHEYYKSMVAFLGGNLHDIIDGHVSPTMHHLSAAAACRREGGKLWDSYWEAQRHECTMLRNPDSTFTGRPTKESQTMGRNNDMDLGPVWNTAHWTIILCLEKDNLPVWMGKGGKGKKPGKEEPKEPAKEPPPEVKAPVTPSQGDKPQTPEGEPEPEPAPKAPEPKKPAPPKEKKPVEPED
ncbi:MAG: PDZ domain-containing protein [Planctomycetes bacterium]|nr:PDZ domain-containing protein [Planctomycetota bacterium]